MIGRVILSRCREFFRASLGFKYDEKHQISGQWLLDAWDHFYQQLANEQGLQLKHNWPLATDLAPE